MSVIRWEEPPVEHGNTKPKKPLKHQPIADALKTKPGEWALVFQGLTSTCGSFAHRIRAGQPPFDPKGTFESRVSGAAGSTRAKLYARYIGEPTDG